MTNEDIVDLLDLTAKLMELHDGDANKIKSYASAAYYLDKYNERSFSSMTEAELVKLQGVGKSIAAKILEIVNSGTFPELSDLLETTPEGVLEMFKIKGIGVKKIRLIWRELGIESVYELEQACENGSIAKLKGFGGSTQQKVLDSIAFLKSQKGKVRMDKGEHFAKQLKELLLSRFEKVEIGGDVRRGTEIIDKISILIGAESPVSIQRELDEIPELVKDAKRSSPFVWRGAMKDSPLEVTIQVVAPEKMAGALFIDAAGPDHLGRRNSSGGSLFNTVNRGVFGREEEIYEQAGLPYIVPEMREGLSEWNWAEKHQPEELVTWDSLKGILHNHSTYSDGRNTLEQMADYCRGLGFEYLGIADHSQSAGYANGLTPDRVMQQIAEIDRLNARYAAEEINDKPFKILKGIESDILSDGSLDYSSEILSALDFVVASIHSNLTMSKERAMERLLRAIENPYTTILGHPTGRLLVSRAGYPVDHRVIIDACAANNVIMEINASPWRLDIDWRWIDYCMEKGVKLSINPDAHETAGYYDMHYGVKVARKGGLIKEFTFNALGLSEIETWLKQRKEKITFPGNMY
jgi:DNA polymerase (family 10)